MRMAEKRRRLHLLHEVVCHFTNPFTGDTLFTQQLKEHEDTSMSIGYVYRLVKDKLGCNNFCLKVGSMVLKHEECEIGLTTYAKFILLEDVQEALAYKRELAVKVIRLPGEILSL